MESSAPFHLGCHGCRCRHSLEERGDLPGDRGSDQESPVGRTLSSDRLTQSSKEPLLFAVLQCLSTWPSDFPFPHSSLVSLCSTLLQFIHTLNDLCTPPLFPSSTADMQARGSSHVDVSNRLSVLILIEARIFRTIRVAPEQTRDA